MHVVLDGSKTDILLPFGSEAVPMSSLTTLSGDRSSSVSSVRI